MKTVWKYSIPIFRTTRETFMMPVAARIVHVAMEQVAPGVSGPNLCFWAEADPTAAHEKRDFEVVGTGQLIPAGLDYRGTVQVDLLVLHLYERMSRLTPPNPATTEGDGRVARP